ncbi:MAG: histidine--tRNA ligase [Eubacteriaceae bacterium]|nr:histidine--tRNA ligase [Eubacteriaceae bacterium]
MPQEMILRDDIESLILKTYRDHGFERIETPAIESLDYLLDSEGGENLKMLFTIMKRGEKLSLSKDADIRELCDIGLRYDLTLPLSRFYSNNSQNLNLPFKAIQIGNVYRAERPQKGRFRSFKQCDIDIIGDTTFAAEVELIDTTSKALERIGFGDFIVRINDRRILSGIIRSAGFDTDSVEIVSIILDKKDKIGRDGVINDLVEKEFPRDNAEKLLLMTEMLTEENLDTFEIDDEVKKNLKNVIQAIRSLAKDSYKIIFDPTLVRGMGYYTGMIFEISYGPYGFSIAGGGRYDNMIGKFSKESVPAVGFSIGFERIISIMMEENKYKPADYKKLALIYKSESEIASAVEQADQLRKLGYSVSLIKGKKKLGKQLSQLETYGFDYYLDGSKNEGVKELGTKS